MSNGITFRGYFNKATTLIDGGWRVSFDLDCDSGMTIAELAALIGHDLQIAVLPVEALKDPLKELLDG